MKPELKKLILSCKTWSEFDMRSDQYIKKTGERIEVSYEDDPEVHAHVLNLCISQPREKTDGPPDSDDSCLRESIRREREKRKD